MSELTERTKITLGLAVVAIGGAAVWITSISINVAESSTKLQKIETQQTQYLQSIQLIQTDLAVIKERVESVNNKLGGSHGR